MLKKIDSVTIWLCAIITLIVIMVCLGGITRLTGSGLSITEWKPIMGAIPPLNETEWSDAFSKYRMIPQFLAINASMTISDFKLIFFWEYFHRLVARLIALVILLPGLIFIMKKKLDSKYTKKILIGFSLGLGQGFLGWFMVSSGLSELVYVSHLRLTAHLMLAMSILAYWTYVYLSWKRHGLPAIAKEEASSSKGLNSAYLVAVLLILQLTYGGIVAGLKAGFGYNSFPKMNGEWIPLSIFSFDPKWINFFNNMAMTQFIHRWVAVLLVATTAFSVFRTHHGKQTKPAKQQATLFLSAVLLQFFLGVMTLIYHVPTVVAVLHQLNACLLVVSLTSWIYYLSPSKYEITS